MFENLWGYVQIWHFYRTLFRGLLFFRTQCRSKLEAAWCCLMSYRHVTHVNKILLAMYSSRFCGFWYFYQACFVTRAFHYLSVNWVVFKSLSKCAHKTQCIMSYHHNYVNRWLAKERQLIIILDHARFAWKTWMSLNC